MPWEAWTTLGLIGLMIFALMRNWASPDTTLLAGLTLLMTFGLFSDGGLPTPMQAAAGFGNEGLITIAVLFVVAAGMAHTGAMQILASYLLGRPKSLAGAQLRMMLPVAALSAFLNNTPIVAMFIPVVRDWCRKANLPASRLFMPLSYAAILGGTCTLIGTSTNLVVHGLVLDAQDNGQLQDVELGLFTISPIGIPATIVGVIYVLILSPKLLPNRQGTQATEEQARQYTLEMLVEAGSAIDGHTIEKAGLRHLPGVYLADIERDGQRLVAVGPEQVLRGNDRLIFVGIVESVVDLQKIRGLVPATEQVFKLDDPRPDRCLVEAVVSDSFPHLGKTIRDSRFRTHYNAAVIAVHRGGEHLHAKIGDIDLQPGDTLLLETHPRFVDQQRNRRDFFLVSAVADSQPIRHDKARIAIGILLALVVAVSFTPMRLLNAALLAAGLMVITGCLSMHEARNSVNWRVLLAVGAAIGIGEAMKLSGAAEVLAQNMLQIVEPLGQTAVLAGVYLMALLFSMMVSHVAAAVLVFPIAQAIAISQGYDFMPFAVTLMIAASADFANPVSYPTHLMVYGAGGYRFSDYMRFGLLLNLLIMATTVILVPLIWPLI